MKISTWRIKRELKSKKLIAQCARQFGVTGQETRLKICYLLCKYPELSVSKIADFLGISTSAISQHLTKLKDCQIVRPRRSAQTVFYSLEKNNFTGILKAQFLGE